MATQGSDVNFLAVALAWLRQEAQPGGRPVSHKARAVLMEIAGCMNLATRTAYPGTQYLAQQCDISSRHLPRMLAELLGTAAKDPHPRPVLQRVRRTQHHTPIYSFTEHAWDAYRGRRRGARPATDGTPGAPEGGADEPRPDTGGTPEEEFRGAMGGTPETPDLPPMAPLETPDLPKRAPRPATGGTQTGLTGNGNVNDPVRSERASGGRGPGEGAGTAARTHAHGAARPTPPAPKARGPELLPHNAADELRHAVALEVRSFAEDLAAAERDDEPILADQYHALAALSATPRGQFLTRIDTASDEWLSVTLAAAPQVREDSGALGAARRRREAREADAFADVQAEAGAWIRARGGAAALTRELRAWLERRRRSHPGEEATAALQVWSADVPAGVLTAIAGPLFSADHQAGLAVLQLARKREGSG